jgi:fumarylacetoacetate (FAA) hydrolase
MKLCLFAPTSDSQGGTRVGRVEDDCIVELEAPGLVAALGMDELEERRVHPLHTVQLCCPIPEPPAIRDFLSFEDHVREARKHRGEQVPPEWYEIPVFYFSNPAAMYGPDETIPYPAGTAALDYELEVAGIIGSNGLIAGFTIMNDWSARDLQMREMRLGLGPAKGKDFATSLGPVVVTVDEFPGDRALMTASVNGEERSRGDLSAMYRPWSAIVEHAAGNTRLRPGDVIGSGTVGTGCILEHGDERWLQSGDVVELEVAGLGKLRNRVV